VTAQHQISLASARALAGMLFALFYGGAQPAAVGLFPAPWDKLAHVAFFMVLTLLLLQLLPRPLWVAVLLALLIGFGDEWHQLNLPGRQAGWGDIAADLFGVLLATGMHLRARVTRN
jgi:VanZ family protein